MKLKIEDIDDNKIYQLQIKGNIFKAFKIYCEKNKLNYINKTTEIISDYLKNTKDEEILTILHPPKRPVIKTEPTEFELKLPNKDKNKVKRQKAINILKEIYKRTGNCKVEVCEEVLENNITIRKPFSCLSLIKEYSITINEIKDLFGDGYLWIKPGIENVHDQKELAYCLHSYGYTKAHIDTILEKAHKKETSFQVLKELLYSNNNVLILKIIVDGIEVSEITRICKDF